MGTKVIGLRDFESDTEKYLRRCSETGQTLVVELPDHRRVSIGPWDESDDLINALIANNEAFRALLAESAASPRKPMRFSRKSKNSKQAKKRK